MIQKSKLYRHGGLKVVGTEKHEARRIDEQLRGRSGRQGEIGESIFYLSLEDEIVKIYGNKNKIKKYKKRYKNKKYGKEIKNICLSREIKLAQKRAENRGYSIRKRIVYYDDILNLQRTIIYKDRRKIIEGEEEIIKRFISYFCDHIINDTSKKAKKIIEKFESAENIEIDSKNIEQMKERIYLRYLEKKKSIGDVKFNELETSKILNIIDNSWIDHLEKLEDIKQGIELQMYGRYNPIEKYAVKAKKEFEELLKNIKLNIITQLMFSTNYN